MKKFLILVAFFALVCYIGQSKAQLGERRKPSEEWLACAKPILEEQRLRSQTEQEQFVKDVCYFYNKPIPECLQTYGSMSEKDQQIALEQYVYFAHIHPKCGN